MHESGSPTLLSADIIYMDNTKTLPSHSKFQVEVITGFYENEERTQAAINWIFNFGALLEELKYWTLSKTIETTLVTVLTALLIWLL